MIDGWEEAIKTMRVGERAIVRIVDPDLGYGSTGFAPIVPPNAEIELDLEILEARSRSAIDFDTLAIGDPNTPVCESNIFHPFLDWVKCLSGFIYNRATIMKMR